MTTINLNRVQSIIHDDILANKRPAVISDYEMYIENDQFFNDIELTTAICSVAELQDAINVMNADCEFNRVVLNCWNGETMFWQTDKSDFVLFVDWKEEVHDLADFQNAIEKFESCKNLGRVETYLSEAEDL